MTKITRTFIAFVAACLLAIMLMTVRCFAYDYSTITGTKASGAEISGYSGALEVNVVDFGADKKGKKDSSKAIQKALDYAIDNGSNSVQIKVVVPKGKYRIDKLLEIYSNTWLYLEDGATIVRNFDKGCMIKNAQANGAGGYGSERNIVIEGGCWDGNPSPTSRPFSNMRFGHMKNLWIKNVEIKNNYNGHHVEIGGVKGITVEDCDFHGYTGTSQKEAIQLDTISNSDVFPAYEPFDDTPCDNAVIKNNKFHDLIRGLGSHSACLGVYYTNTLISGNSFYNMSGTAIVLINHKKCIIENNTMKNVGCAIDFKYMTDYENANFHVPNSGYAGIKDRLDDNANTIIRNNDITVVGTYYYPQPYAIQIFGKKLEKSYSHPDYNYTVKGVKIVDNTIKTAGSAVRLTDVSGIFIGSNDISYDYDRYNYSMDLIWHSESSQVTVTKNKLTGTKQNSVYISGGSGNEVSSNTIKKPGVSGVYVSGGSDKNTISGNTITSAGSNGIKITKESKADVRKNTVKKSKNHGLIFTGGRGKASDNILEENGLSGFMADNSASVEFFNNTCNKNKGYGIKANKKSQVKISGNSFADNSKGDIYVTGSAAVLLNAPDNVKSQDICSDKLTLTWDEVSQADGYYVYRKTDAEDAEFEQIATVTDGTSFTDYGLVPKTRYVYKVKAFLDTVDSVQEGSDSADMSIKTKLTIVGCTTNMRGSMSYTGKERTQIFDVFVDGETLIPDVDYRTVYSDNVNIGTAKVTVIGIGQYCDSADFQFDIMLKSDNVMVIKPQELNRKSIVTGKPTMKSQGYEVAEAVKDKLDHTSHREPAIVVNYNSPSQVIAKARADMLDLRVRSYRELTGETIYGAWL